jgi:hypothetical protein
MKAQAVTVELRKIAKAHGGKLCPEDVVEAARPTSAPLHSQFQWDNTKAGHLYRLEQARHLIRVCVEYYPHTETTTKVFVSLTTDRYKDGGYRDVRVVLGNREQREQMLHDALDEMQSFRTKYAGVRELANVFAAMTTAERKLALTF